MREVVCRAFGPLDDLVIEERPSPELPSGPIRVRVPAAGVNFVDALLVQGLYQIKPPLPFVAGGERVGVVTEASADGTSPTLGDRVLINGDGRAGEAGVRRSRLADRRPGRHVHAELHDGVLRVGEPRADAVRR